MSTTIQCIDQSDSGAHPIVWWMWDFGDGATTVARNPHHTFDEDGQYDVRLTILNNCGSTHTTTQTVNIHGDNMETHTEQIVITDNNQITIQVPIIEPLVPIQFIDDGLGTPLAGKQVELLDVGETVVMQTRTTDSEGIVFFEDVAHGEYNVRITY